MSQEIYGAPRQLTMEMYQEAPPMTRWTLELLHARTLRLTDPGIELPNYDSSGRLEKIIDSTRDGKLRFVPELGSLWNISGHELCPASLIAGANRHLIASYEDITLDRPEPSRAAEIVLATRRGIEIRRKEDKQRLYEAEVAQYCHKFIPPLDPARVTWTPYLGFTYE